MEIDVTFGFFPSGFKRITFKVCLYLHFSWFPVVDVVVTAVVLTLWEPGARQHLLQISTEGAFLATSI